MNITRRKILKSAFFITASSVIPLRADTTASKGSALLLASDFTSRGGWKLDTQFHNSLGFDYLLAHGMGDPVENAYAEIKDFKPGKYRLWVYTKDWCPGNWAAPGQFKVNLLGLSDNAYQTLPINTKTPAFGTQEGWGWQDGGTIEVQESHVIVERNGIGGNKLQVSLHDLTGFDGRCAAVYLTDDLLEVPPKKFSPTSKWTREKMGLSTRPDEMLEFDTVIAGGGMTGCAAAIAAAEQGLKVAIIQNRPVLGGNASGEIGVHPEGIYGTDVYEIIIKKVSRTSRGNGFRVSTLADKARHDAVNAYPDITVFLNSTMYSVQMQEATVKSCNFINSETQKITQLKADNFIECTGDGWLAAMAGAEFRYGREANSEFSEGWDKHGELWSPKKADNRVLGTSVLWNSKRVGGNRPFPSVPWAAPVAKNSSAIEGDWPWEYSDNDLHQIDDAEHIRDHMFRAIYGSFANAKKSPKNANVELEWVAFVGGKRESRRIVGDYIFNGYDAVEGTKFEDSVCKEKRHIDSHYQRKLRGFNLDFISQALFKKPKNTYYYIPYRSLYAKDVSNLFIAGRCFSCSHIGLAGPRVMLTCAQMGVAVGFAASLCKKHKTTPRGVYTNHLQSLKELCGMV